MMKNRASIVIARSLSTIQNADAIIVMQGQIIENGSHDELIDKKEPTIHLLTCKVLIAN